MRAIVIILATSFILVAGCGGCPISTAPIQALAAEYVVAANASIDRDPLLDSSSKDIRKAVGLKLVDALKRAGGTLWGQ